MRRVVWIGVMTVLAAVMYYLSRFWGFRLWDREGLLGFEALRPQGGLLGRWLRGTDAAPFELLIWVIGCFAVLTLLQRLFDKLGPRG